jgi:hypothetical protein
MSPILQGLIIAAMAAVLTAVLRYVAQLNTRLRELEAQHRELATKVSPLWAKIQAQISSDLHHPHARYLEMDLLLEKLEALTISPVGRDRLKVLLVERSHDPDPSITDDQKKKAQLMLHVMDLVVTEANEAKADEGVTGV